MIRSSFWWCVHSKARNAVRSSSASPSCVVTWPPPPRRCAARGGP
jgi:hypothetical protein